MWSAIAGALACLTMFCMGCHDYPEPISPQDRMAHGRPIAPLEESAKPGDPGVVSGRLTLVDTFAPAGPVEFVPVALFLDGREVAHASTDAHGAFLFVRIENGHEYELRVVSERYKGSRSFVLHDAAHIDLVIQAKVASQP